MIKKLLLAVSLLFSLICLWFFYHSYWKYRHLFNEQGRYFNEVNMVVYTDSAFVWGVMAVVFALPVVGVVIKNGFKNK